jgi:hypothetical protein
LEINLNRFFSEQSREQWSLLFVDYSFIPPNYYNYKSYTYKTAEIYFFQPHILTILHNAKIKYRCMDCHYEWTTARGRAIFQAEIPAINKYNVLFSYLFTQKCQICHQDVKPSWYLDEATRVMKDVCHILNRYFYYNRQFQLPHLPDSSSEERHEQRLSSMKEPHRQNLCRACQEGSCFTSHHQHYRKR